MKNVDDTYLDAFAEERRFDTGEVLAERFEIRWPIGVGGMGRVYRALDRVSGRDVALKVLLRPSGIACERFGREARILAELDHPSIVRHVADGETPDGAPFLAMEWVDGTDLQRWIERTGALSIGDALFVVGAVAEGLAEAHARGIVHRDIKPSNILLEGNDLSRPRLADFGLASIGGMETAAHALTVSGEMVGTPSYMAPEQVRGARGIDARADVFALGCVLFECLTGRPAFGGQHARAVVAKILFEEAPRVSSHRGDISVAVDALVASMLAKSPVDRPVDAAELLARLTVLHVAGSVRPDLPERSPDRIRLGDDALRWSYVVVATLPREAIALAVTETFSGDVDVDVARTLDGLALRYGAEIQRAADGTIFALLRGGHASAGDGAAMAARCALALSAVVPTACVGLAALRAASSVTLRVGDLFERVVTQRAVPGQVTVDHEIAALLETRFSMRSHADGTSELERELEEGSSVHARLLLGKATPLVGRERELASLQALLREVRDEGVARAALVTAGPGVGKTRLRQELSVRASGFEVWLARADAMSAGSPLQLISRLVCVACGLDSAEGAAQRREALDAWLAQRIAASEERERVADFLGEVVGAARPGPGRRLVTAREDPIQLAEGIRIAWETFVEAAIVRTPVLFVLEDLHWGDAPSIKLVDSVLRRWTDRPLAVLAFARPEVLDLFPRLWAEREPTHISLPALAQRARERLIRHVLGSDVTDDVLRRIADLSAGNAFYLEELIRAAAMGVGEELPLSVATMIESRLDVLPPASRRIVHLASVFGEIFWLDGLRSLLPDEDREAAAAIVADLCERELFTNTEASHLVGQREGERELAFRHALVREAAYASLGPEDARVAHGIVADWLVTAGGQDAFVLAEHCERAGFGERAASHYADAATDALRAHDLPTVVSRARRGLVTATDPKIIPRLRVLEGEALCWLGDVAEGAKAFDRAVESLRADRTRPIDMCYAIGWATIASFMAHAPSGSPIPVRAAEDLLKVEPAERERPEFHQAVVFVFLAFCFHGDLERAEPLFVAASETKPTSPRARGWLHFAHVMRTRYRDGDAWTARGLGLDGAYACEAAFDSAGQAHILANVAIEELSLAAYEAAREHAEAALTIAKRFGLRLLTVYPLGTSAIAAAGCGDFEKARERLDEADRMCRELGDGLYGVYGGILAACAARRCGDPERAVEIASWVLDRSNCVVMRCGAKLQLAAAVLALGHPADALAWCMEVIEAMRPYRVRGAMDLDLWETMILSLRLLGREEEATAAAARARTLIEARVAKITDDGIRKAFLESSWAKACSASPPSSERLVLPQPVPLDGR